MSNKKGKETLLKSGKVLSLDAEVTKLELIGSANGITRTEIICYPVDELSYRVGKEIKEVAYKLYETKEEEESVYNKTYVVMGYNLSKNSLFGKKNIKISTIGRKEWGKLEESIKKMSGDDNSEVVFLDRIKEEKIITYKSKNSKEKWMKS
jgi:hypothetical protein